MAWTPTAPGLEEARGDAIVAFLQSKLSDLNTSLARSGFNSTYGLIPITSAMVQLGDGATMFELDEAPLKIRLTNGDQDNAEDLMCSFFYIGVAANTGWKYDFVFHAYVYMHPDLFSNENSDQQIADRERCLNRLSDWFIGEVNSWNPTMQTGGTMLPLTSAVIGVPNDIIARVIVTRMSRGIALKDMGASSFFPALYARIEGCIM